MALIKINFRGGIMSPGELYNLLVTVGNKGIREVRFSLRQQLYIEAFYSATIEAIVNGLKALDVPCEVNSNDHPNIISSYPAEEVFISGNWLREGIYKDLFADMNYEPRLKINISNSQQSFTPLLTGNINWIASPQQHFWHLFIRFPKTNAVYEWKDLVYTNDVARMSQQIEKIILEESHCFYDNHKASGDELYQRVMKLPFNTRPSMAPAALPMFNLPYYEGFNQHNGKYWLGIYRREEWFSVDLLKDICRLCLQLKIGQICCTPWKSLIIKGIEEKDRILWNQLLSKHQVNIRHAANELNFQVEDNCPEGLRLKQYLVKHLNSDDTRTFGICIGIKTRKKSEVFSSILVKRRPLLPIGKKGWFYVYDILVAKDYNPNERTAYVFSKGNPKFLLPEQLRRALLEFYRRPDTHQVLENDSAPLPVKAAKTGITLHQCPDCLTIYDERVGEPANSIAKGTGFQQLPSTYCCPLCETPKHRFQPITQHALTC